ncbi:hypothetical protein LBMAG42_38400 [Deltaproteobacteria bacterium]|nr:hypothetical protein LBMAG42_38400 [Deltaproteobacteria bacterium]
MLTGLGILGFICAAALASPTRITLHIPAAAGGTTPPSAERIARITRDIHVLAEQIGARNQDHPEALARAEAWAIAELEAAGLTVRVQDIDGVAHNLIAERAPPGGRDILVVGAHLDTCGETPGADDNASGVAVLLELARNPALGSEHALRFVIYGNEEPPYFQTERMGSRVHANSVLASGEPVVGAWVLESVGVYSDAKGSQRWPAGLGLIMPGKADFVMMVTNPSSSDLLQEGLRRFRAASTLPSIGASVPGAIQGVDWSDHAEYWRVGLPAVMVTDMPPFRNVNYHEVGDTPEKLDPSRIAAVVDGMEGVLW